MKARLIVTLLTDGPPNPPGTIVDHPEAYRLVRHGCAEPADEECRRAADVTPEQMARAQATYQKVAAGIWPEDYAAWDRGWMRGYNPDGTWKPGPNYSEVEEHEYRQRAEDAGLVLP
jgi:hypothetical protein